MKPLNQTFVPSLVVPVFPAAGTSRGSPAIVRTARLPVPRVTTSSSIDTMMRLTRLSST